MVTKEQAMNCKNFLQVKVPVKHGTFFDNGRLVTRYDLPTTTDCKPIRWRVNGKCKTWKRNPERFQLPIKHGLYSYGYLTNENAHLFIVEERS